MLVRVIIHAHVVRATYMHIQSCQVQMKSTKAQPGHALVHTEHLVGSEDTRHYVDL